MATKLPTPTNFRCTQANQTSLELDWDVIKNAGGYNLSYYNNNTGPSSTKNVYPTGAPYTVTDLTSGTTYTFLLSARPKASDSGRYTNSDIAWLYATTTMKLAAPTGLTCNTVTSTSAQIDWNAVENATDYKVEYRRQGDTTWNE